MKLASAMVDRTLEQFDAEALPDNHPAVPELNKVFGDHTFFLNDGGLHVVEPRAHNKPGAQTCQIVKIADWEDVTQTSLAPHKPERTDIVITLPSNGPDKAA